jgi:hypothetical protein
VIKGKQYLVKLKGCHPKEATWMKLSHLNHLLEMVENFELKKGMSWCRRKHTINKAYERSPI